MTRLSSWLFLACTVSITAGAVSTWSQTITGKVFLDANANGQYDEGEQGLAKVRLTDGVQFVSTDDKGSYLLQLANNPALRDGGIPIVAISWASGYWPSSPWFVRINEPISALTANFGLRKDSQALPFEFIHATDAHAPRGSETNLIQFRKDVGALRERIKFTIFTGDNANLTDSHTFEQSKSEYEFFSRQTHDFPVPWFAVSGNHDLSGVRAKTGWDKESPYYGYGFHTRLIGPLRWSFDYAGIHFAGVDYNRYVTNTWIWGTPKEAVQWLDEDLKQVDPGTRIFLFVHFPEKDTGLEEIIRKYSVSQIFHGHDHQDRSSIFGGAPAISSSSLSEIFEDKDRSVGYRMVRITEQGMETFYRATGQPHAITIEHPRSNTLLKSGEPIQGSFYDPDHKIQRLTIKIGDHEEEIPFVRGPLVCRFKHPLQLDKVAEGIRPMVATVTDGNKRWQIQHNCFVLTGCKQEWINPNDAVIELDVAGIDSGVEVRVNGSLAKTLSSTKLQGDGSFVLPVKGGEMQTCQISKQFIQRLNHVKLIALKHTNGTPDRFCLLDLRIKFQDKVYRDIRFRLGAKTPLYLENEEIFLIDLLPGK